ncbi:MAG: DUF2784 domain-containing protein [Actinomycetota bacterium]|nr:DUF2784 domain-containing protein [Actinomycetota bacterium]
MNLSWRVLADAVVAAHYAYIAYLLLGGFIAWRWSRTIGIHLVAVVWATLIVTTKVPCPLTALQNHVREAAGQRPLSSSFLNVYIRATFYPAGSQTLAQASTALVVLASWAGYLRRRKLLRSTPQPPALVSSR